MKLLLDSCVILWWLSEPEKLGKKAYQAITDGNNQVWVSVASLWELGIKHRLGRIHLPFNFLQLLHEEKIQIMSIESQHALEIIDLPDIHQDPFDRMLIAQAKCNDLTLITKDKMIQRYPIMTLAVSAMK